ncbi:MULTISPECIES: DUF11 domain-containing protein [unclassified Paenibacillus]|uniref:DUF11 domain-containing protein n=1 Tax=unclassified Paenibacillus TaxID=185978 RepID=UPI000956B7B8|nr:MULTISPECIES: DUF11 domain-containing protein [unclassified Paenibacillus]ASS68445.1 DUF11 domain-containing protein [Paenibacillus sp. RUD330]SIR33786.1 conserved repeat domain-containing protein [Paenibacillus sp. RU4X]SIR44631.1 conserved repeat domain-containing protein [Paenibacillus sp. RU4T]
MPFVNRFLLNNNGAITYTGNTLGLSRSDTVAVPGTVDSIGAFVTADTSQTFGLYPPGTTGNYALNNSTAILLLPAGSSILYAELVWGGTYINNGVDLSAFIDNPVSLTTPSGLFSITPDPATRFDVLLSNSPPYPPAYAYVRSADVTGIVQTAGAGNYTAGGIVGTIVVPDPTSNHAMWTLAVAYANASEPLRNLSIRVGAAVIQAASGPVSTVITGFATPFQGALDGRAQLSAQEGDANKTGDMAQFGPTAAALTTLSGPNNFAANFFASQINGDAGLLDTTGTFGTRNQINGTPGTNIVAGRQGYDVTNISVAGTLLNAQTSAVFNLTTSGDGYLVDSIGLQIDITPPLVTIVKSTPAADAVIGDIVTYALTVQNTGVVNAGNVQVFDTIDETSVAFIPNSVTLNGVPVPGATPETGVTVGLLAPGATAVITFRYQVTAVPFGGTIDDQGNVAYTYQPTPDSPVISTSVPSNIVHIPVFSPVIGLVKSGEPTVAFIGNPVTYALIASNTGNISANVTIADPTPAGTTFIPNSVTVNGVAVPGVSPTTGIPIGPLDAGATATITFQVLVVSAPPGNNLVNQSTASFTYMPPDGRMLTGSSPSNIVTIPVVSPMDTPNVTVVKSAGAASGIVGDVIAFTVVSTNNSIAGILNAVLTDSVPAGYAFVAGSAAVNGVPQPAADPLAGIAVGTLAVGASATVTFDLAITAVPTPPVLTNTASLEYDFLGGPFITPSNPVDVTVLQPVIVPVKRANTFGGAVGQIVNYSVTVTNSGNVAAVTTITDPLNPYSTFVAGSVFVNGIPVPAASPLTGIVIGSIAPGESVVVSYDVALTASPPTGVYDNQAAAAFTFQSPSGSTGSGSAPSNVVQIVENDGDVAITKSGSETFGIVGDIVTFTLTVSSVSAFPATDVIVSDNSTPGSVFVPGSVTVGGAPSAGNINTGVSIGTLAPGQAVIVTFQEEIVSLPEPGYNVNDFATAAFILGGTARISQSNIATVTIAQPVITAVKSAAEPYVFVGDEVHYQTVVTNTGSFNAELTWFDLLPPGSVFVENSLTLNGFPVPGENMLTGAFIGTVEANSTAFITFKLKVVSYPPTGQLMNQGNLVFSFTFPNGRSFTLNQKTNPVFVPVLALATLAKSVSASSVAAGNAVAFYLTVSNPNTAPIQNVVLTDALPSGLSFVPGSLSLNGTPLPGTSNLSRLSIGTVPAQGSSVIRFLANADFAPLNPVVVNTASFSYGLLLPSGDIVPRNGASNPVSVTIEEHEE